MCDPSPKAECVPAFARESERGPFVREVEKQDEKRLGDKIYGGSFAGFSPSADVEGSQRTGKCMYIKAWRNHGLQMLTTDHAALRGRVTGESGHTPLACIRFLRLFFRWRLYQQLKTVLWPGEGRPLFRRVCRCVRSFEQGRVCTRFHS